MFKYLLAGRGTQVIPRLTLNLGVSCLGLRSKTCSACREGLDSFILRVLRVAFVSPGGRNIKALKSQTGVVKVGVLDRNDPANVEIARTLYPP